MHQCCIASILTTGYHSVILTGLIIVYRKVYEQLCCERGVLPCVMVDRQSLRFVVGRYCAVLAETLAYIRELLFRGRCAGISTCVRSSCSV